ADPRRTEPDAPPGVLFLYARGVRERARPPRAERRVRPLQLLPAAVAPREDRGNADRRLWDRAAGARVRRSDRFRGGARGEPRRPAAVGSGGAPEPGDRERPTCRRDG